MTRDDLVAAIPAALQSLRRWIAWGPDPDSKLPKCPLLVSNKRRRASTRKPLTWTGFDVAQLFWEKYGGPKTDGSSSDYGIGFVFTDADPALVYIDLDDAVADGSLREWAAPFVAPFLDKAYIEISPSGHGLHIIARGKLPQSDVCGGKMNFLQHQSPWAKAKEKVPEVAVFAVGKYTTITGDVIDAGRTLSDEDCSAAVAQVWELAGIKASGADRQAGPAPDAAKLAKVDPRRLPKAVRDELKACEAGAAPDRSAARFKLYVQAAEKLEAEEIFALVVANDDWYKASGASEKGYDQTWSDIVRCCSKAETAAKEFAEATAVVEAEQEKALTSWKDLGLPIVVRVTKEGAETEVAYGTQAMKLVLMRHPDWKGRLRRNVMTQQVELDGKIMSESVSDIAEALRSYLAWDREPQLDLVRTAIIEAAEAQWHNPVADWLRSLRWDGVPRIDNWLVRAGCEGDEVSYLVGRKWLISLAARALRPGCKCDTVLILEGPQGMKKSTLLEAVAGPDLFTDSSIAFDRDDKLVMHKHWIVELSELSSFKRADIETVKNYLSRRKDDFRAPYGRAVQSYPRHFVIVGSTNSGERYLEDTTGNRRYWPVKVRNLNPDLVREERAQLLAEAVVALEAGEPWWFEKDPDCLREAQENREAVDALEDAVVAALEGMGGEDGHGLAFKLAGPDGLMTRMGMNAERKDLQMRVAIILRKIGFTHTRRRRPVAVGSKVTKPDWMWRKATPENPEPAEITKIGPVPSGEVDNGGQNSGTP
jgi:predicted P-loop ATPase